jgi:hypothetical protein
VGVCNPTREDKMSAVTKGTTKELVALVQAAPTEWLWMTGREKDAVRELDRRGIGRDGKPLARRAS